MNSLYLLSYPRCCSCSYLCLSEINCVAVLLSLPVQAFKDIVPPRHLLFQREIGPDLIGSLTGCTCVLRVGHVASTPLPLDVGSEGLKGTVKRRVSSSLSTHLFILR